MHDHQPDPRTVVGPDRAEDDLAVIEIMGSARRDDPAGTSCQVRGTTDTSEVASSDVTEPNEETDHYYVSSADAPTGLVNQPVPMGAGPKVKIHRVEPGAAHTVCGRSLAQVAPYEVEWNGEYRCDEGCWS